MGVYVWHWKAPILVADTRRAKDAVSPRKKNQMYHQCFSMLCKWKLIVVSKYKIAYPEEYCIHPGPRWPTTDLKGLINSTALGH